MKQTRLLAAFAFLNLFGSAALADDRAAIRDVVEAAYVQGVHGAFDAEAMRRGFHADFRMYVLREGVVSVVSRDEWIARMQKGSAAGTAKRTARADYTTIDVAGDAATVRLELHRNGKHAFTDLLSLYRTPDGWKIVAKTFQARP